MAKNNIFDSLYIGIEKVKGSTVLYNSKGENSVILEIKNPVEQYCSNAGAYYSFNDFFISILRLLGEGYCLQKQDILCKQKYRSEANSKEFLSESYFRFFEGREYTEIKTYLTITQEKQKTGLFSFDNKKWNEFHIKIQKLLDFFRENKVYCRMLNENEIRDYIYRYVSFSFEYGPFSFNNFKSSDTGIKIGKKNIRCVSLVDVGQSNLPSVLKPFRLEKIKSNEMVTDIFSFLNTIPECNCVLYNQVIYIPSQKKEKGKLSRKMNRHASVPDPANELAAKEIEKVLYEVEKDNRMLVYLHSNLIVSSYQDIDVACNYIESQLDRSNIRVSRSAYNQLELFQCGSPGCAYYTNPDYDRFFTLADAACCMLYKEKVSGSENTPLKVYYTNRIGIPKAIDITGKEGAVKLTDNSNFFSLGPSGSGKSFHMNSVCRQLYEQNTDIILVDTGNSYEGLCSYVGGKYISYTEEKPITMNPFKITKEEDNIEKRDFLKNLILLIWKGPTAEVSNTESKIIRMVISQYYATYFNADVTEAGIEQRLHEYKKTLLKESEDNPEITNEVINRLLQKVKI